HTTVLPFIIIEMRTTHHQYPSRPCGLIAVFSFAVGYVLCPLAKVAFFSCLTVLINIYYVLGEILNSYIWDCSKCKPSARLAAARCVLDTGKAKAD
ncbi:unnamed protein product, partial [Coregonus sp. 'balchen']